MMSQKTVWMKLTFYFLFFSLPMHKMTNPDLARLLKSDEIQNAIRAPK